MLIFDKREFNELNEEFFNAKKKIDKSHKSIINKKRQFEQNRKQITNKMNFWNGDTSNRKK